MPIPEESLKNLIALRMHTEALANEVKIATCIIRELKQRESGVLYALGIFRLGTVVEVTAKYAEQLEVAYIEALKAEKQAFEAFITDAMVLNTGEMK